jgi:putative lipoic acid-binding regulatory protein
MRRRGAAEDRVSLRVPGQGPGPQGRREFRPAVLAVFERHAPGFDQQAVVVRDSRKGTLPLTITITATGPEQLDALHRDLLATGLVQMVL